MLVNTMSVAKMDTDSESSCQSFKKRDLDNGPLSKTTKTIFYTFALLFLGTSFILLVLGVFGVLSPKQPVVPTTTQIVMRKTTFTTRKTTTTKAPTSYKSTVTKAPTVPKTTATKALPAVQTTTGLLANGTDPDFTGGSTAGLEETNEPGIEGTTFAPTTKTTKKSGIPIPG